MYCKQCGKEIADDSVFCRYCGERFQESHEGKNQVGSITFYREKAASAALASAKISIDGKPYCELKNNERYTATLPHGTHTVDIKIAMNPTTTYTVFISSANPNPFFSFKVDMSGKAAVIGDSKDIVPTKKKAKNPAASILGVVILFVAIFVIISLGKSTKSNSSSDLSNTTKADTATVSNLNETNKPSFTPVSGTVGNWEIKINDFSYSDSVSVGVLHEYEAKENSKYCIVSITVKNIGKEAATFLPIVYYGDTTTAKIKWNDLEYTRSNLVFSKDNLSSEDLNPLVSTNGNIAFELPNEVIESNTPPIIVFSYGSESLSFELIKE